MALVFPVLSERLELGVGLHVSRGATPDTESRRADIVSTDVVAALKRYAADLGHVFVSWQPRELGPVDPADDFLAYDEIFERIGHCFASRSLRREPLGRGAFETYRRGDLLELTNALVDRYAFAWVNEDVARSSIQRKPVPGLLTRGSRDEVLRAAIRHTQVMRAALMVPLLIEFPGLAEGAALFDGPLHAYEFLRIVAHEAAVAVTIDTRRLISYQCLIGKRGAELFAGLDRLPLDSCYEIRVSVSPGRSSEMRYGSLFDEQLELVERLVRACPNVRVITFEGLVDDVGQLVPRALFGFEILRRMVASWKRAKRPSASFDLRLPQPAT